MNDPTRRENEHFENEVLRIARARWPSAAFSGTRIIDGREVDGVFETEECVHVIEATTSRKRDKAKDDIEKLTKSLDRLQATSGTRAVRGWFITRDEPTADQRRVADKHRSIINTLSFSQFQMAIVDSKAYLSARDDYPFGSVRDPAPKPSSRPTADIKYVPLDILNRGSQETVARNDLVEIVAQGSRRVVLLGDYGAGKSMTLREVYYDLRRHHLKGATSAFPLYLNLRDHYGQTEPAEVIERHARSIGFPSPSHLVRAWRAGYVHLLIDGFDEISAIGIQGIWRKLRDNRYRAMQAVRRLIAEHPSHTGLLVAGRAHFFDNDAERHSALGISPANCIELSLNEFTDSQIATYLKQEGLTGAVPPWLPSRPLLVGYLAAGGLLRDLSKGEDDQYQLTPAAGWDTLLDLISDREAKIEAGIDGPTVRRIIERIATKARASQNGLGPLTPDSVVDAFKEICGYAPDDRGMVLLQRLPGLGVDRDDEDSRKFMDIAFADACRAGDLVSYVESPFDFEPSVLAAVESSIEQTGLEVASWRCTQRGFFEGNLNAALIAAQKAESHYMAADIARLILEGGFNVQHDIVVEGVVIPELELGEGDAGLGRIQFHNCFFVRVDIASTVEAQTTPMFRECYINELDGRVSIEDLPANRFDAACVIESYAGTLATTAEVLTLDLPLGTRVCLTILKKLYEQRGSGRKENALHRGLDHGARRLVPDVLGVLRSEGLAIPDKMRGTVVWRPNRSDRARVGRMISAPTELCDSVLERCSSL